uniref:O-fucosyltransferase family protein n=1 Tax=Davidia involucrata TaxID=16924 RepID=A0A5B7C1L1_DAVIN
MTDIIDMSSVASVVQTIDLRDFASSWCSVNRDVTCMDEQNIQSSSFDKLRQCGSLIAGLVGNVDKCLYALNEDCKTTVWTYQQNDEDGLLDSFQTDEKLQKKKNISYVRRRQDVSKTLGTGSEAELATVLALGSLFTAPYKGSELYIDIHEAPRDQRIQSLIQKLEFLPFVPEITNAGKGFAHETIKAPFLCAQLRLLDGQFKNHWKNTFLGLKQKVEYLRQKGSLPISIFVMTDLPEANWTGSYLGDLARDSDSFKLHILREEDQLVKQTAKKVVGQRHGMKFHYISKRSDGASEMKKHCLPQNLPDILLYIEETVCSCASLGFVGTAGSTIAENIELMRKFGICLCQSQTDT